FYYLRYKKLIEFWKRATEGGRKSFRYEELEPEYFITSKDGILVPYLDMIQKDLEKRS
ncbi:MAG: Holliday junction resolvase RecU, partial [Lachnospiraceae bacterium]